MNRVLYSGKVMDENELRRVNCILQTQASNMWSEIRTYDFLYKSSYRNYLNGFTEFSDSSSEYSDTISEIGTMNTIVASTMNVEGVQEAQQAAQQAADDSVSNREENENEIIDGLPDPPDGTIVSEYSSDFLNTLNENGYSERREEEAALAAQEALDALTRTTAESQENIKNNGEAWSLVAEGEEGTKTYYNPETGQTQTATVNSDGTVTLSGVTASDGTVGTVTQNPDGTMTFTTEDGTTMKWSGDTPLDIINQAGDSIQTQADQDIENASKAAEEANTNYDQIHNANNDAFNQAAHEEAAKMAEETPSGNEGGYSESDSSTWSDPSYDPSEWGGF